VWDAAKGAWETVDPQTGEIGGQMPAGRGLGVLAGRDVPRETVAAGGEDFNDEIPF
jgi:hypothetical protein